MSGHTTDYTTDFTIGLCWPGLFSCQVIPLTSQLAPVATMPGIWHYRVSTGTGQPGVSLLCLSEVESLKTHISVW